ncbi:MAG: thymidylate synthase [Parcubacteria bacterium C7867-003]|nr:MAG: thymidylate synthase [Parcubacteria bacterium C7867-003]
MITPENLYQPDKFKVILGEGKSVGFCTLWNEPKKILEDCPEILEKSAIVGTLYSRQGVNIILRNLALNPQIQKLYIWNNGALSCSPFGVSGKDILLKLWDKGLTEDNEVLGADFKVEKEIDRMVVEKIIKNVSLIEVTDDDIEVVANKIENLDLKPYMEPVRFADSVPEKVDVFPSEKVGFLLRGKTIIEAWTKVVDRIMRYGTMKDTQYGTQQRELVGVTWVIENEDPDKPFMEVDWPNGLRETIGLNDKAINHYKSVFLSSEKPEGVTYTYGNRLMKYPNDENPIDQVNDIIVTELKKSIYSTRAIATTIFPPLDIGSKEQPCITQVHALYSNKKLHMLVSARSHDIFKAGIPNAFGLRALQKSICQKLDLEIGCLQITSQSAHIYEGELSDARQLVECAIWEREPSLIFDPATSADPRGMFVISVKDSKITAYFKTPSGDDLLKVEGKNAREVANKIAQLELVSKSDHLLDIGMELEKAEIALSQGILYTQDKPLPFEVKNGEENNVCIDC